MAWEHLSVNRPHLVYIILGGFTSLFMLCSSVIKERLYIGEATVATICGVIFGPHAADLINPLEWGNTDQITLEFSRVVLVVQCFAVGVELPKHYMEKHWRSVTFLLVPVMTFGWLITSLFIWSMFYEHANWLDCLCIAACVTATDPVLASSVVGKGKFAKRVPKHLRDLLSAESGCNDGMAFPFVYLAVYIIRYQGHPNEVALHWFCYTILYECLAGSIFGVAIGYIARRLIRYSHEKDWIDRESFLVFYFVLALFCAGAGSMLGMDDLLVGFACGVGFSNDGWFTEKTEESHVSNVIDLLINLTFFVYFGTIIPWAQFNAGFLGLDVWRLVVIAILVLFFRRLPIMLALKSVIPDIKTWREAFFAGHFGPIGVGAIFVAILARAELETESTTPLDELPPPPFPHRNVIELIWPITCFLVITSILVHGSSIAVFTLGKHINTLSLTMSYTKGADENTWMDRLPRIQSRSRSQMSLPQSESSLDNEKGALPPGMLPAVGRGPFLRRQKEGDNPSRSSSRHRAKESGGWGSGRGPGGPISQSAIAPRPRQPSPRSDSDTLAMKSDPPSSEEEKKQEMGREEATSPGEIYEEGDNTIYEDEDGNVLAVEPSRHKEDQPHREAREAREGRHLMHETGADRHHGVAETEEDQGEQVAEGFRSMQHGAQEKVEEATGGKPERPGKSWREGLRKMSTAGAGYFRPKDGEDAGEVKPPPTEKTHGPARAYQFGNTIIVEDEDGEVIKKYDIPAAERKKSEGPSQQATRQRLDKMGKMLGLGTKDGKVQSGASEEASNNTTAAKPAEKVTNQALEDDDNLRFTITTGGRRMSKVEFIDQIRNMDPKRRVMAVENSDAPEPVKREARKEAREQGVLGRRGTSGAVPVVQEHPEESEAPEKFSRDLNPNEMPALKEVTSRESNSDLKLVDSNDQEVPFHDVSQDLRNYSMRTSKGETAAERRRREALGRDTADSDSEDDGTDRVPPTATAGPSDQGDTGETAAERRRREGALGIRQEDESDSEDDDQPRDIPQQQNNVRFADQSAQPSRQSTLKWGKDVGR
ncbi:Na+/H+ antiporter [Vermiconidia calcicola]|uniref:Na+/H+ antiporter n=1 Tax=Vermiconidia calcicola TaxID=1690605 RepID=A0ACC3N2Q3_9PEZI|nr:Na+/H+ antiporter [Vermiconidia calcicola]